MYRSKNRLGGKANTLGVMVDWLGDPYQATLCDAIERGVTQSGANLLVFVGGALPAEPERGGCRHKVYDLAGSHNLDGLILFSSTLSHEVGLSGVQAFALKFSELPLCSLGLALPNTPSVTVDNEAGMKQAVRHLIERHEARRIAFINGPAANAESKIRLGAYKSVLEEHGLTYDEQWVLPGTFMMDSGVGALHTLGQRLGPRLDSLDAIVAANDNMAIGAMNALERMGISVPDGVAVVGFDDVEESRLCEPSLTTVRQPLERVGLEAVRRLLQASGGANTPFDMRIDTELVVRQSCGCLVAQQGQRARPPKASHQRFQVAMMGQRERVAAQLGRAARGLFSAAGRGWEQQLLGAMIDDLIAGSSERFPVVIEQMTQRLGVAGANLHAIDDVMTALRSELVPLLQSEPDKHCHAEDLFHSVRLSNSAAIQRSLGRAQLELTRWSRTIAVVCNALSACGDNAELQTRVRHYMPQLDIRSCFVSVYDVEGDPSQARLTASYDAAGSHSAHENRVFKGRELLPPELATVDGVGKSYAVLPLQGSEGILGHVLFEYSGQHAYACGVLAEAMGIAIRGFARSRS